jgi:hypothetical protein
MKKKEKKLKWFELASTKTMSIGMYGTSKEDAISRIPEGGRLTIGAYSKKGNLVDEITFNNIK